MSLLIVKRTCDSRNVLTLTPNPQYLILSRQMVSLSNTNECIDSYTTTGTASSAKSNERVVGIYAKLYGY